MKLNYKYIAEDQYGNIVWIKDHPRKELMQWAGVKSAQNMYMDDKNGNTHKTGYVVSGHWFSVFTVGAWEA